MIEREILINLFPKSDYEKLLFATRYIAELKESLRLERIERGKLKSEIDELNHKLNTDEQKFNSDHNEKLLFSYKYVEELEERLRLESIEKRKLKSEIDELKQELNSIMVDEQKHYDKQARKQVIKEELYKSLYKIMQEQNKKHATEMSHILNQRDDLIYKLINSNLKNQENP